MDSLWLALKEIQDRRKSREGITCLQISMILNRVESAGRKHLESHFGMTFDEVVMVFCRDLTEPETAAQ